MKEQYLTDLREGQAVDSVFAVSSREVRLTRGGQAYLALDLADRSGRMPALAFGADAAASEVRAGDVVRVRGTVTSWRGELRVSLESVRPALASRKELVPSARRDIDELLGFLRFLIGEVREEHLGGVLHAVFDDAAFLERFVACPAARTRHHAWLGGLLEHTVDVASVSAQLAQHYPYVDADLLLAGALLHDIGKVDEFAYESAIGYTDAGRFVGHVVLGERRVTEVVRRLGDVPEALALRLSHVLLSHHGELEWGSPRRPATLEAVILHHVDNLDAKMTGFMAAVSKDRRADERWTDANNLFRRPLYVPRSAEDDRPVAPEEDELYTGQRA